MGVLLYSSSVAAADLQELYLRKSAERAQLVRQSEVGTREHLEERDERERERNLGFSTILSKALDVFL
jgi:hypothetical protein